MRRGGGTVLHWRLGQYAQDLPTVRPLGPAATIPPTDHPSTQVARQAAELMSQRWRDLRAQLGTGPTPAWLTPLDPRPDHQAAARSWRTSPTSGHRTDAAHQRAHAQRHVDRLERRAEAHRRWRATATIAQATRRQIALVRQRINKRHRELSQGCG